MHICCHAADGLGSTPLHEACYGGHTKAVRALLTHNADPDAPDADDDTPLHVAARRGHLQAVEVILVLLQDTQALRATQKYELLTCSGFSACTPSLAITRRPKPLLCTRQQQPCPFEERYCIFNIKHMRSQAQHLCHVVPC